MRRLWVVLLLTLLPLTAEAARRRATFFPKDLDMELLGDVELDTRVGVLRAHDSTTVVVPDVAVDIGINRRFELNLDGQGGLDPTTGNWLALDQLWVSGKHMLWDDHGKEKAWALGLQQGPRFAVMPGTWGFGYQALGLLGVRKPHWQGVISLGGYIDPQDTETFHRPIGALAGVDWSIDLDDVWDLAPAAAFTLHGEGHLDAVATLDLERDFGKWGSARVGVIGGWQDSGRIVGLEVGWAPRFVLVGKTRKG